METSSIYRRIKQRLDEMGISERQASIRAVGNSQFIRNIRKGTSASPRGENIVKLAQVLGVSEAWLLGTSDDDSEPVIAEKAFGVRYGGIVEAGAFRTQNDVNQGDDYRIIPVAPDPRFPRHAQFAFEVVGDSMTQEKIFEGMWVLAVDLVEYERLHGPLEDKKLVIAERRYNGLPERELTVKRLRLFQDHIELQPASENPMHKPIVFPLPLRESEEVEATIRAVLLSAIWLYR